MTRRAVPLAAALLAAALLCAGCGSGAGHRPRSHRTPSAHPLNGAEPAVAPPLTRAPDGRVVSVGAAAEGIVAAPRAGVVAVAVRGPDRIALIGTRTGDVIRDVPIAGPARHLSLDGPRTLLVPEAPVDRLLELPLTGARAAARARALATGSLPHDAAAAGGRVFTADEFGHAISVFAGARRLPDIRAGFVQPGGIATVAGDVALVDVAADTVTLVDPHADRVLARARAGTGPTHDVAGPGGRLYVTDTRGGALYVFAIRPRLHEVARVPLPDRPYGIAADAADDTVWVTETGANRVVEFDARGSRPRILAAYPTVRQPNSVAVDPVTGRVYVAGATAGVVQELRP